MTKRPGHCVFCGKPKLSKEHVFGEWLRAFFPRDANTTHTAGTMDWGSIIGSPRIGKRKKSGHTGSLKVRVVCEACNNGWMSDLEGRTIPILSPMIVGQSARTTTENQRILATWAAKTAMTSEYIRPKNSRITQAERKWLMDKVAPPSNWHIWIAAYGGQGWRDLAIYQQRGRLVRAAIDGPGVEQHYIEATTFGVGQVVFMVIGTSLPTRDPSLNRLGAKGLFRIWPIMPRSILWPPAHVLGDREVNALANVLSLSNAFDQSLNPQADWTFAV